MVAGTDLQLVILRLDSYDANCVVSSLWGGSSTFDLFQFTDKHSNPLAPRRQSLRISLRDHHHQIHGCIPCTLSFRATTTGVLANVRSTAEVWRRGSDDSHEAVFFSVSSAIEREFNNGANPFFFRTPKTKKPLTTAP
jgi:hypothetical protein